MTHKHRLPLWATKLGPRPRIAATGTVQRQGRAVPVQFVKPNGPAPEPDARPYYRVDSPRLTRYGV